MKEDKIEVELNQEEVQAIIDCYEKDLKYIKQLEQQNKELQQRIDKAIKYMKHYIEVEERKYNDNVMKEFEFVIKLLKGGNVDE